ncbi:TonB-dependent receptor [Prevotella sp. 10(H)]|uniref:SusC/RagA family TonB-linked outer membrane protein n=1 Tax=Prevotella sp. 10(H) TaxID=1158294 RepID=UPI00068DC01E|nr:TonB-dependent receptor [Prevotella sp. 10(H)]
MLLVCFQLAAADSKAQEAMLNLKKNNLTLKDLILEIENQTGYLVVYSNQEIDVKEKTKTSIKKGKVKDILHEALSKTNIYYLFDNDYIVLKTKPLPFNPETHAENIPVPEQDNKEKFSGTITDTNGEPLIGVNIAQKGTTTGTMSDPNGKFSLNVSKGATVVISYVGFISQEFVVEKDMDLSIVLVEDIKDLDEVIVVGYGTQRKGLVTGSISLTKGEDIVKSPAQNLGQSLQGRISGVIMNVRSGEPGADGASITIRGKSTTGNTDPLILIDGIANRSGNWDRINPNDIESVTVLKDASAAIYGSRSANGVILITTKRGKTGKPTIDYSYNIGIQKPTRLPEMADAATFAKVVNEIDIYNGGKEAYTPEQIELFRNGSDPLHYPNTDWVKETLRKSSTQQSHNLSIRGGSENIKYFIGGGYSDQDAIYKNSSTYNRTYNVRSNIDAKINKHLTVSVDLAGRIEEQHYPGYNTGSFFWIMLRAFPTTLARYPNGLPASGMTDGNPVTVQTDETGYRDYKKSVFNSTFSAKLDLSWLTPGLTADAYMAYDKEGLEKKEWYTPFYYYVWDEATDTYNKTKNSTRSAASLRQDYIPRSTLTLNAKIMYNRTFNAVHGIDVMLGYEQSEHKGNDFWASRSNYLATAIDQMYAGSSNKQHFDNGGSAFEQARRSYFGRVAYDYAGKYMAQFNFREDGSYIFPAGNRWGFFPGVSVGWRISEENFIKDNLKWMDNLKLKASYGKQGNDNVGAFQYLLKYTSGNNYVFGGTDVQGVYQEGFPNKNITWEVADTYNAGVEGNFWNGLLGFEFEVFKTKRSNILRRRNASIPEYTGLINLPDENIGKVQNKGVELQLNHRSRIGKVNFNASGNFLYARNKVIYMDETPWGEGYDYLKEEGQPLGAGLYYQAIGIFRDQAQIDATPHVEGTKPGDLILRDVDNNGEINEFDRVRYDLTSYPEIIFGLTLGADWKDFDISVLLQGQARAKQMVYSTVSKSGNFLMDSAEDRWAPDNPNGSKPRADGIHNNYGSDFFLKDASFLRLKNIEVGYTLPKKWFKKLSVSNCRIYLSAYNLFTIDKIKVMDPESTDSRAMYYPQLKIFNTGVNITF